MKGPQMTRSQQGMIEGMRSGIQADQQARDQHLKRKYGMTSQGGGMGSALGDQMQKEKDNWNSPESYLQRNPGAVNPGSTNPTGDLYKTASENSRRFGENFARAGMQDQVRDQAMAQEIADPYMREQDKRNIDRMNAASKYSDQAQKKAGTGVTVNYRQPGSGSRIKGM
jgi:hypothetical protein